MNTKIILGVLVLLITVSVEAQSCKVLMKQIGITYEGDCKKGKAEGYGKAIGEDVYVGNFKKGYPHGIGTYTYSNGDVYEGAFKKGMKDGEGTYTDGTTNAILTGFWKNDDYLGKYKNPYKLYNKSSKISIYRIEEKKDIKDISSIIIYLRIDYRLQLNQHYNIIVHHGKYKDLRKNNDHIELTEVQYPIKLKLYTEGEYLEFEIFEPGFWDVKLDIAKNLDRIRN